MFSLMSFSLCLPNKALFTSREGNPSARVTLAIRDNLICLVTKRIANKMADKGRVLAVTSILLSLLPVIAAYQCHGVLLCCLLISTKRQQVAMLNAAMEYNKAHARLRHVKRRIIRRRRFQRKPGRLSYSSLPISLMLVSVSVRLGVPKSSGYKLAIHRLTSVYSDWRSASKSIP